VSGVVKGEAEVVALHPGDLPLPRAPKRVADARGQPLFGVYQGALEHVDWKEATALERGGPLHHFLHHKKWQFVMLSTPELLFSAVIVDLGYISNAWMFLADLAAKTLPLQRSFLALPKLSAKVGPAPAAGARSSFRALGARMDFARDGESSPFSFSARLGKRFRVDATLDPASSTPLTFLGPITHGGRANCTQKVAAARVTGVLELDGRRIDLAGARGGLDYTNGILARETSWRWAFAQGLAEGGEPVALNLVAGFNETSTKAPSEDAVWVGGEPISVGKGVFSYAASEPLRPWRVKSECGAVDLVFTPAAQHAERHNLGLAASRFLQVAGTFEGTLRVRGRALRVRGLPGVAEDQSVKW